MSQHVAAVLCLCRFLTYLARSRRAEKNLVVVSHGHMMEACLKPWS